MEIIRNYLESMFAQLPNTPEVIKAKQELRQMMEDKYSELIAEGKADNEAIGIVISEFGNLDEIAEELGISRYILPEDTVATRTITMEEARDYMNDVQKRAFLLALGVFFCIISVMGPIIGDTFEFRTQLPTALGIGFMFASAAVGVGLIVFGAMLMKRWSFLNYEPCTIRMDTMEYVRSRIDSIRISHALMITIGIVLCIVSVIPVSVAGTFNVSKVPQEIAAAMIFLLTGIGVFLIVASSVRHAGFNRLLTVNEKGTIGAAYGAYDRDDIRYESDFLNHWMPVYWPTVTCIYLIISFLTFHWWSTWIIWPVAAIIHKLIGYLLGEKKGTGL
ncbi:MAG: hypothetical protein IKD85_05945 [Firmicutes bacterium]|nr:hypothetical protein [Bacillota bacterium]